MAVDIKLGKDVVVKNILTNNLVNSHTEKGNMTMAKTMILHFNITAAYINKTSKRGSKRIKQSENDSVIGRSVV